MASRLPVFWSVLLVAAMLPSCASQPAQAPRVEASKEMTAENVANYFENSHIFAMWNEGNVGLDDSSIGSNAHHIPDNSVIMHLVEEGRKNPKHVGRLVTEDLKRRIEEFPKLHADMKEAEKKHPGGPKGFGVSSDGEIIGNLLYKEFSLNRHAIMAAMWVLVNIDYVESVEAIASLGKLIDDPARLRYPDRDMLLNNASIEMPIYAVKTLLDRHPDSKYAAAKRLLDKALGDQQVSNQAVVKRYGKTYLTYTVYGLGPVEAEIDVSVPNVSVLDPERGGFENGWRADDETKVKLLGELWQLIQKAQTKTK